MSKKETTKGKGKKMKSTAERMMDAHTKRLAAKGYSSEEIDAIIDDDGMEEDLEDIMD